MSLQCLFLDSKGPKQTITGLSTRPLGPLGFLTPQNKAFTTLKVGGQVCLGPRHVGIPSKIPKPSIIQVSPRFTGFHPSPYCLLPTASANVVTLGNLVLDIRLD